jgi:hypothetical protein
MAASQFLADAILNWLKGESFPEAPQRGAFLSLHRGEPGPAGTEHDITAEVAAGRAQLPRELIGPIYSMPEGGRQVRNDEKLLFEGLASRDVQITHVGFWSEPVGGEFYCGGPLISHTEPVPVFSPLDVLEGDQVSIPFPKLKLAVAGYIAPRGPVLTVELVDPGEGWGPDSPTGPLPAGSGLEIIIERDDDGRPIGGTVDFPDGQGDGYEVGDIIVVDGATFRVTGIGEYVAPPEMIEPPTIESFAALTASAGEWGEQEPWGPYDRGFPALHPSGKWILLDSRGVNPSRYVQAWPWDDFLNYEFQTRVANDGKGGWGHRVEPVGTPPSTGIRPWSTRFKPVVSPSGKWVIVRGKDSDLDAPNGWGNDQYWTFGFNADTETGNPFTDTGRVTGIEAGLGATSRFVRFNGIIFHPSGQYLLVSFGGSRNDGTDVPYFCVFEWNDETGEIASGAFYPNQYPCFAWFDRYYFDIKFTPTGGAIIATHQANVEMLDGSIPPQTSDQGICLLAAAGLDPRKGVTAWSFNPQNAGSGMNPIGLPLSTWALPTIGSYVDELGRDSGAATVQGFEISPSGQTVAISWRKSAYGLDPFFRSLSFYPFDENAGFGSAYFDLTSTDGELSGVYADVTGPFGPFGLEFSPAADLVAFWVWNSVLAGVVGVEPSSAGLSAGLSLNFLRFTEGVGAGQIVRGGSAGSGFQSYYGLVYSPKTATIFYSNQNFSGWAGMYATRPANYVPQEPPSELTELVVTEAAATRVTIYWSWEPGPIRGFLVELSEDGVTYSDPVDVRDSGLRLRTLQGITQPWWSSLPGQPGVPVYEYSYTLEGLTTGTNYWIRVRAFNEAASSVPLVVEAQTASLPSPGELVPAIYTQSSTFSDGGLYSTEPASVVNMTDGVYDIPVGSQGLLVGDPPWPIGATLTELFPTGPGEPPEEWIQMDFGSVVTFNSIVVGSDFDNVGFGTQFTEFANIAISNDEITWEAIGNVGEFLQGIQRYGFPNTSAQYVRLTPAKFQIGVAASEFYADAAPFTGEPPLPSPQSEWELIDAFGGGFGNPDASNSGNITLAIGPDAQEGDLLIAHISYRGDAPFSAPAGWTIHEQVSDANIAKSDFISKHGGLVASMIRGASNPDRTFTRTGGGNALGRLSVWRHSGGNVAFVSSHGERQPKHSVFLSGNSLDNLPEDSLVLVSAFGATIFDLIKADSYPALPPYSYQWDGGEGVIEANRWRVISALSRVAGNTTAKLAFGVLHKAGAGDTGAFRVEAGPATEQLLVVAAWAPVSP